MRDSWRKVQGLFWLSLAMIAAGCVPLTRPPSVSCSAPVAGDQMSFLPVAPLAQSMSVEIAEARLADSFVAAAAEERAGPVTLDVLTLSSGGQYGSFGAGFLTGWSQSGRPDFELVTGVSAGALLAPIAFAGPQFDHLLDHYNGLTAAEVFSWRFPLAIPASPSVTDPAPMQAFLRTALDKDLIARLKQRHVDEDAQLLIAATNLDTTEIAYFNLAEIAARLPEDAARDCITEVLMASAAVPVIYPPRHIDNSLFADGGLREHVLLQTVESARAETARRTGRAVAVNAYIVVNGALAPPDGRVPGDAEPPRVDDTLISYAQRSAEILADEVLRDSIAEEIAFAEANTGWTIRGMAATADIRAGEVAQQCKVAALSTTVDGCLTAILFAHGVAQGRARPIPWMDAEALLARTDAY